MVDLSSHENIILEDRAFAGCEELRCVLMPANAEIGDDTFDDCENIVLFCQNDEQMNYAARMQLPYVSIH